MATDPPHYMSFDKLRLRRLKLAYKQAVDAGLDQFVFDDVPLNTAYAKYVIEYVETQLGKS